jgi:hypothetical protein
MNQTTRCFLARGARRAAVASFLILISLLAADASRADDNLTFAEAGFFVQSPGSGAIQGPFTVTYDINTFVGADRFYNAGFTGTSAVMANIEAGYIWNSHETMTHVGLIPTSSGAAGEFDRHATAVGMVMGGRLGGASPGPYQRGMAPDAQLFSGAIATSWPSNNSSFPRFTTSFFVNYNAISTYGPYRAAFINGLSAQGGPRTADVINVSWQGPSDFAGRTGTDTLAGTLDALAYENPTKIRARCS